MPPGCTGSRFPYRSANPRQSVTRPPAPRNTASGKRQSTAGLISAANGELRSVLIEAGHRLIRYQWRWATLAASMRDRGKPPSLVAAAVANRWTRWLYYRMVQAA